MDDLAVPDLVAPPPEEPTSKPSSLITPWAPSLEDIDAQKDVVYLWHMFPKISDKFLLHTLEEGSGNPAATVAWATAINGTSRVQDIISNTFPTAPPKEVQEALLSKNGNVTAAYTLLARKHQSVWDRDHFALSSQIAQKLLVMDETLAPEFHDPNPSYAQHEAKWWDTMIATKEYKVADSTQKTANWTRVTAIMSLTIDVTLWVAGHVESLSAWHTDKTAFDWAMSALWTFHNITALTNYCTNHPGSTESALDIVLALLEDGLASPGAATWAMEHLSKSPQAYRAARFHFAAYGMNRCTLWNQRNLSLAAWKATRYPPTDNAQAAVALPPPPAWLHQRQIGHQEQAAEDTPILASATMTPKLAHPCSLPGAAGWALPVSSSAAKYIDLAARTKKQTRSVSASRTGTPLEGLWQPLRQPPKKKKGETSAAGKN